jgi:hypothetical protein
LVFTLGLLGLVPNAIKTGARNVSVNYAFRFSGPVTALTARCVWYGVGARSICQADPSGKCGIQIVRSSIRPRPRLRQQNTSKLAI